MKTNWLGYIIIAVVLLIEIPRFTGAYSVLDPELIGLPLTALGTGIMLPLGSGYVFHTWWKTHPQKKGRNVLLLWFGTLMVLEPIILVPWGISQLRGVSLSMVVSPGPGEVFWITVVMMSPFIMMAAVVNGLALQRVHNVDISEERVHKTEERRHIPPTTYDEFIKQYPNILEMTGAEIVEKTGNAIHIRTGTNWKQRAKNNGHHA